MTEDTLDAGLDKARAFFTRAEEVASTDNFDYAIDLYMDGLRFAPDALEDGHIPLRRLALIRQGKGGKKSSMFEVLRKKGGKTPLDEMLNAEFLLAKDPDNLNYAETMLKSAVAGGFHRTGQWLAFLIFEANKASAKPSFQAYLLLKDMYAKMQLFTQSVSACEAALQLKPDNDALRDELRDLCASMTMEKGKYGQTSDFRGSINNKDEQDRLHSQESVVKTAQSRRQTVETARQKLAQDRVSTSNVLELADALADLETDEGYAQADALLEQYFQQTKDFTFKRKQGELSLRKLREMMRRIAAHLKNHPDDKAMKTNLDALSMEMERQEFEHFRLCQDNYPTEMRYKYEFGRCLMRKQEYDKAIPMFQEAQRDVKLHLLALDKLGLCFLLKGWHEDAIDIFQQAMKACPTQETPIAKDIRYNLARAYEDFGKSSEALELYRKLAQIDFRYKDVGQRIDFLRKDGKK